jgi:hypothetical protein
MIETGNDSGRYAEGNVKLKNNVFLAPMAGVTDMAFRILCKRQGCGLTIRKWSVPRIAL